MPMVVMNEGVNESSLNRSKQHDLPTPLSPMRRSLIYDIRISWDGRDSAIRDGIGQEEVLVLCRIRPDLSRYLQKEYSRRTRKS